MNTVAATFRLLRILYFAFLVSVPIYFVVGQVLGGKITPGADLGLLRNVFWLAGATMTAAALVFCYRMMPSLARPSEDLAPVLARLRGAYIASFVLAESVAVLGLVLRLLGGSLNETLPFFGVAVALFVLLFPRLPDTYVG